MRNQTDIVRFSPSPSTLGECLVFNVQRSTLNVQRPIKKCAAALIACLLLVAGCASHAHKDLATEFQSPPDSAKPRTWWHWVSGNVSKEGITADLEAMKRVGVGG